MDARALPAQELDATPTAKSRDEVVSIQYLRGLAALLVIVHHAHEQIPGLQRWFSTTIGASGVDIFFVISGFVMIYTTSLRKLSPVDFLARRAWRIVPLYWALTVFTAVLLIVASPLAHDSIFTIPSFFQSLLFIPHFNPGERGSLSPMLKLGWTLNYEMFFYVIFALLLGLAIWKRTFIIGAIFIGIIGAGLLFHPTFAPAVFYTQPIILEFVFGCVIGGLDRAGLLRTCPASLSLGGFIAGAALLFVGSPYLETPMRAICVGLPAALVVLSAIALERRMGSVPRWRFLETLGDASYSLYLSHLYAVIFFRVLWNRLHLPSQGLGWALVFMAACLGVGVIFGLICYALIEQPLLRAARRFGVFKSRRAEGVPAG